MKALHVQSEVMVEQTLSAGGQSDRGVDVGVCRSALSLSAQRKTAVTTASVPAYKQTNKQTKK